MLRIKNLLMLVLIAALGVGIYGCEANDSDDRVITCLLYTSPSPRDS